jgi:hypothetical protein
MTIVDKKCEKIHRDSAIFQKKYEKYLKDLKEKQSEVVEENFKEKTIKEIIKSVTKNESLLTIECFIGNFSLSPKFTRKHADFQRKVVHTFSELQSVIYNLYTLNSVVNYPFENVKIENYFNGLFAYNMYINLRSRSNSLDYIKMHLFKHSRALYEIFNRIYDTCLIALPYLLKEVVRPNGSIAKKKQPKAPKKAANDSAKLTNDCVNDSSDDQEFVDLNNKFSQLLKNAE